MGVEVFEFLIQGFELFLEILIGHDFARRDTHVASGVERPALRFNFIERGGAAQTEHVGVFRFLAESFLELRLGLNAAKDEVEFLAAIERTTLAMKPICACVQSRCARSICR